MRKAFVQTLQELAYKDKRIILLTGDLGFSVFEEYIEKFPQQYINAGIAEQSMTGIAAGLAIEGRIPILYSIIPFITMRNFEQIRNDICYQNLNVKIVGIGAGFSYGPYGHTHHGLEDIGVLRSLPNITILCPGDPVETRLATNAMMKHNGPVYLRLGRAGEPVVYEKNPEFSIGKGIVVRQGKDVSIIATSTMLYTAMVVSQQLTKQQIDAQVISMHTIKPIDTECIYQASRQSEAIVTLEEHFCIGGLGSAVAEVLSESGICTKFKRFGIPDKFTKMIGDQEFMRKANGLSIDYLVNEIQKLLQK